MADLAPKREGRDFQAVPAVHDWADQLRLLPFAMMSRMFPSHRELADFMPAFDISLTSDHVNVKADLPSIEAKDLDISLKGNLLTVRGERKEEHTEENTSFFPV